MTVVPWGSTHLSRRPGTILDVATDSLGLYVMPPVAHLQLAARVPGYRPADLEALLADRQVIGLRTLRGSAFLMPVDLLPVVVPATRDRNVRAFGSYLERSLTTATYEQWAARVEAVVPPGEAATKAEIVARLDPPDADRSYLGNVISQLATESRFVGVRRPTSWRSADIAYTRWSDWLPGVDVVSPDPDGARATLARWYLRSWGPATVDDLAWWAGLPKAQARVALAAAGGEPTDGIWDLPGAERDPTPPAGVRLLPWWDTLFVTWRDRSRFLPDARYPFVYDRDGNATATVLLDGEVIGVWSLGSDDADLEIRVARFGAPDRAVWRAIEDEAVVVAGMVGADAVRVVDAGTPVDLTRAPRNRFLRPC